MLSRGRQSYSINIKHVVTTMIWSKGTWVLLGLIGLGAMLKSGRSIGI